MEKTKVIEIKNSNFIFFLFINSQEDCKDFFFRFRSKVKLNVTFFSWGIAYSGKKKDKTKMQENSKFKISFQDSNFLDSFSSYSKSKLNHSTGQQIVLPNVMLDYNWQINSKVYYPFIFHTKLLYIWKQKAKNNFLGSLLKRVWISVETWWVYIIKLL